MMIVMLGIKLYELFVKNPSHRYHADNSNHLIVEQSFKGDKNGMVI